MTDLQNGYVLVVDNEEKIRKNWLIVLRSIGIKNTLEAECVTQAQELLSKYWTKILLIIMEIILPPDEMLLKSWQSLSSKREKALEEVEKDAGDLSGDSEVDDRVLELSRRMERCLVIEGGLNLLREIDQFDKPVIFATTLDGSEWQKRAQGLAPVSDFLTKPILLSSLERAIRKILAIQ